MRWYKLSVMSIMALGLSAGAGLMPATAHGQIFVTNGAAGTIGEYTTSGATVNASLVSGLNGPIGIAVVPEPSAWALLGIAAAALLAFRPRRGGAQA